MTELKTATLTSSLLARKGSAAPSMYAPPPVGAPRPEPPAMAPVACPPTASSPAAAHGEWKQPADAGRTTPLPKLDHTGRIKMSLRLYPTQHLRLKLSVAMRGESAQKFLITAMERYMDQLARQDSEGEAIAPVPDATQDLAYRPLSAMPASLDFAG